MAVSLAVSISLWKKPAVKILTRHGWYFGSLSSLSFVSRRFLYLTNPPPPVLFTILCLITALIPLAFVVACLISSRSLWTSKRQDKTRRGHLERQRAMILAQQRYGRTECSTPGKKCSAMYRKWNSVLDTLADLEGTTLHRNPSRHLSLRFTIPSGRMTVDFSQFGVAQESTSEIKASHPSYSSRRHSTNGFGSPVRSTWTREPRWQALDLEFHPLQHAEPPPPSYHRPGTAF